MPEIVFIYPYPYLLNVTRDYSQAHTRMHTHTHIKKKNIIEKMICDMKTNIVSLLITDGCAVFT